MITESQERFSVLEDAILHFGGIVLYDDSHAATHIVVADDCKDAVPIKGYVPSSRFIIG